MDYITPFIEFLLKSDYVNQNKLFLNAIQATDNDIQIVTSEITNVVEDVTGGKSYNIQYIVNNFKSLSYNQLVTSMLAGNENVEELLDVQKICDYIDESELNGVYPDYGNNITVELIEAVYKSPSTPAIDTNGQNPLAKYQIPIAVSVYEK